jgi:prepilin-type N-terminal cleavage/methylation domain-containing protein
MLRKSTKGYTLIEILLSLLILTVALIPLVGMFSGAHFSIKHGSASTEAMSVAQEIMEEQKARHLKNLNLVSLSRRETGREGYEYSVQVREQAAKITEVEVVIYYSLEDAEETVSLLTRMCDWR